MAHEETARIFENQASLTIYHDGSYAVLAEADALMAITEWNMFRGAQLSRLKADMRGNIIIDGRNIFTP